MGFWTDKKVIAGQLVANEKSVDACYRIPEMIGFSPEDSRVYLTELSDGCTFIFDDKQELADYLNRGDYIPVEKAVRTDALPEPVENRLGLPRVIILNADR